MCDPLTNELIAKLVHHEAMVIKLQDDRPELALIWLAGVEILRTKLQSLGV